MTREEQSELTRFICLYYVAEYYAGLNSQKQEDSIQPRSGGDEAYITPDVWFSLAAHALSKLSQEEMGRAAHEAEKRQCEQEKECLTAEIIRFPKGKQRALEPKGDAA